MNTPHTPQDAQENVHGEAPSTDPDAAFARLLSNHLYIRICRFVVAVGVLREPRAEPRES